jgi:hypothetical protein
MDVDVLENQFGVLRAASWLTRTLAGILGARAGAEPIEHHAGSIPGRGE